LDKIKNNEISPNDVNQLEQLFDKDHLKLLPNATQKRISVAIENIAESKCRPGDLKIIKNELEHVFTNPEKKPNFQSRR